jgi:hypothetical protein
MAEAVVQLLWPSQIFPATAFPHSYKKIRRIGLAFERELLANHGTRPVTYIPYHLQDSAYHTIHGRVLIDGLIKASRDFHEKVVKDQNSTYQREVIEKLLDVLTRDAPS